jgi:hypothetical protein
MKLQIDDQRLRLRLSEEQLDELTRERRLEATLQGPGASRSTRTLMLEEGLMTPVCKGDLMQLQIVLPLTEFLAFARERPRRDGFAFTSDRLELSVEVDVRDSRRRQVLEHRSAPGS